MAGKGMAVMASGVTSAARVGEARGERENEGVESSSSALLG
jgi:hypothetical protein